MARRSSSLRSGVMEAFIVAESSRIPRNVSDVVGPSVFSGLMGMLMAAHAWAMASMLCWHEYELEGPAVKKSSR